MREIKVPKWCMEEAAKAWGESDTCGKTMDVTLGMAFAEILHKFASKPHLGYATTKELIDEIAARSNLGYSTVSGDAEAPYNPDKTEIDMLRETNKCLNSENQNLRSQMEEIREIIERFLK